MLQSHQDGTPLQIAVFDSSQSNPPFVNVGFHAKPAVAPCPTTEAIIGLIGQITGWQVDFSESKTSQLRRFEQGSQTTGPIQGTFSIVDMSPNWPPQVATGHRGKCDSLVELIGDLVSQLQSTELKLLKSQSALAAFETAECSDETELVDSFVPKFGRRSTAPVILPDSESCDAVAIEPCDSFAPSSTNEDDFELRQPVSNSATLICPPFKDWSLGGATGIVRNRCLDWHVDSEERIAIFTGGVSFGDKNNGEATLLVDPLTNEYRIAPVEFQLVSPLAAGPTSSNPGFYLWDSKNSRLSSIHCESWTTLKWYQAIVATNATKLSEMECWKDFDQDVESADDIASMLQSSFAVDEPVLVLQRSRRH